ncbi:MAG: penicillin-binding protein activator [Cellvibrionales bacterium]|nr:penicillin-binding protein activator [Cellvibrionales bacterium]
MSASIWRLLLAMSMADLQFLENADSRNSKEDQLLAGWLALAHIQREDAGNSERMAADVQSWRNRYATHPANRSMPAELVVAASETSNGARPQRIALLPPLTGKWGRRGRHSAMAS